MLPHRTAGVASPLQSGATLDTRPGLDDLPDDLPREVGTDGSPGMRGAGRLRATRSVVPASRRGRRRAGPPGSLPKSRTATDRPCFDDRSLRRVLLPRTCHADAPRAYSGQFTPVTGVCTDNTCRAAPPETPGCAWGRACGSRGSHGRPLADRDAPAGQERHGRA